MTDVYTELLQENSELKTKVFRLEQENKELKEKFNFMETANDIKKLDIDSLRDTNYKLRSALEEIKHILEIHKDELEECLHNDIDGMIQNKINEVLK